MEGYEYDSLEVLADKGAVIDAQIKNLQEDLDAIKSFAKSKAEDLGVKKAEGIKGKLAISAHTISTMDTTEYLKLCEELDISDAGITSALKVLTGKAKTLLGSEHHGKILKSKTNAYGVIKFKLK